MYQTVGHQAIELYAEAMALPLYRRTIQGSSLNTGRNYSQTDGDEVEDLYELLRLVKVGVAHPSVAKNNQKVLDRRIFLIQYNKLFFLWLMCDTKNSLGMQITYIAYISNSVNPVEIGITMQSKCVN